MKLIETTARKMKSPGKIAIHGALSMSDVAWLSMLPHEDVGGWMPKPRNDSVLSAMIAAATPSVGATGIGAWEFGTMGRSMIRRAVGTIHRSRCTNAHVFSER